MRDVSEGYAAEAEKTSGATEVYFYEADFGQRGVFRSWTGFSPRVEMGVTWNGGGSLLQFELPQESVDRRRNGWGVKLASFDQFNVRDHLQDALHADTGREAFIWRGFLDSDGELVGDLYCAAHGVIDLIPIEEDEGGAMTVSAQMESEVGDFDRSSRNRITPASQGLIDPTDQGLKFMARLESTTITFGNRLANQVKEE